jgi:cytochrome subunit of sulfide dehydrogenase
VKHSIFIGALLSNITLISTLFITSLAQAAEVISSVESLSNTPHIRTLAASCAACHGGGGNAISGNAVLAGMDGGKFTEAMLSFKDGSREATVMHRHAKGLNIDEINLLADYFSKQKRVASNAPPSQTLKAGHD